MTGKREKIQSLIFLSPKQDHRTLFIVFNFLESHNCHRKRVSHCCAPNRALDLNENPHSL